MRRQMADRFGTDGSVADSSEGADQAVVCVDEAKGRVN